VETHPWRQGQRAEQPAESDVTLRAEVLSYSRSRGLFAGISLEGSTVRLDDDANERVYGQNVSAEAIISRVLSQFRLPLRNS
jgi:lipid-binding SYLF domain-containing protein